MATPITLYFTGINASRTSQKMQHQRSINNEAQAHVKMSTAQSPPKSPTSEVVMPERAASLKHKKEHSSHSVVGKDVPQGQYMDFTQVQHPVLHSAAPGLDETEILRMELMEALRRHEAANDEVRRLDAALNLRARDFEELRTSSELALQEAHKHAWELEDALSEVQRRMTGSEARVRQMQAHLVGMREKLAEELGAQLFEARAELERTRQELGRSRKETREHRERSVTLEQEVLRLNEELTSKDGDASAPHADLETLKAQRMTASKEIQTPSDWKPASSKTTMTDLTADILQREMDKKGYISLDEHEAVRRSLGSKLELSESQAQTALLKLKRSEEENQNLLTELREQKSELDVLQEALHARFVPVSRLEEKDRELDELKLKLERMQESKRKEQNIENQERQEDSWKEGSPKSTKDSRDPQSRDSLNDSKKLGDMLADPSEEKNKNSEIALETEDQREAQSSSSAPSSPCGLQHSDSVSLLAHINSLKQQLENSEKHYREVLDVYRTRLLSAAQGFMDDEARVALLQIAQMRQECVC
ncbi:uveal autoantigen with coiled-coil domains and ankyrin repeats isoform X2 [Trichomycterus rosablanca]